MRQRRRIVRVDGVGGWFLDGHRGDLWTRMSDGFAASKLCCACGRRRSRPLQHAASGSTECAT